MSTIASMCCLYVLGLTMSGVLTQGPGTTVQVVQVVRLDKVQHVHGGAAPPLAEGEQWLQVTATIQLPTGRVVRRVSRSPMEPQ
ncbi:MAG: hypothetical protein A3G21_21820 [Acidobacteria bacterium RIFCSPLOWO2_12_FULL_66_21]|nr:MAG: hypothetical protein A3G21_21820 [Acidobacteria bacterium RIFCSPLOWO2_12_FULL_66_21]